MRRNEAFEWMEVAAETVALGMESAAVVALRLHGAATGTPKAAAEAWRMYSEKVVAFAELQTLFLAGSLGATPSGAAKTTVRHYRGKVRANQRRLGGIR